MRLLELGRDEGGANPVSAQQAAATETVQPVHLKAAQPAAVATPAKPRRSTASKSRQARVFPIKSGNTQRKPIDLEQLQQRVEVLEQRIKARTAALGDEEAARDLQQLKKRMKLLERNVNSELWAAKQREYSMLQLLAKPTFKTAVLHGYRKFRNQTLPTVALSLLASAKVWWLRSQPEWWTGFAAAWQESFDRARGIDRR